MKNYDPVAPAIDALATEIIDAAFAVHMALGPGLLESVYEACICRELTLRNVVFRSQVHLPITYKGIKIDAGLRLDLLVSESVIVELKSCEQMLPVFEAQLLSYLKLTGLRLGLLINFKVPVIKHGIRRIVL